MHGFVRAPCGTIKLERLQTQFPSPPVPNSTSPSRRWFFELRGGLSWPCKLLAKQSSSHLVTNSKFKTSWYSPAILEYVIHMVTNLVFLYSNINSQQIHYSNTNMQFTTNQSINECFCILIFVYMKHVSSHMMLANQPTSRYHRTWDQPLSTAVYVDKSVESMGKSSHVLW